MDILIIAFVTVLVLISLYFMLETRRYFVRREERRREYLRERVRRESYRRPDARRVSVEEISRRR
ncbi:MAG: hypothetical protein WCD76_15020 [Pyrinomonadaceae bacterium]